jgi:hypothetical protein
MNNRKEDIAAVLRQQVGRSRAQNGQFTTDDAASAAPVNIVDLIRSTLEGLEAPVTEAVPVTSTPPALNDVVGLLRGALSGAYTVNGQQPG